ncbi:DUF2628 domain-containing protein [Cytobacillus suaedae]|nr:DUF2628 domain-containing protein [Cytobacillus suaedae]
MAKWDYAEVFDLDRLKVFLGENKQVKYLRKFGIITYNNSSQNLPRWAKLSWNWSSFFAGVIWMGYRKMYIELIVFSILIILPNLIVSNLSSAEDKILTVFYWLALGLISNTLYYAKCKREITRIKS